MIHVRCFVDMAYPIAIKLRFKIGFNKVKHSILIYWWANILVYLSQIYNVAMKKIISL